MTLQNQRQLFFALFFFIPFGGLRPLLELFAGNDQPGLGYVALLGLVCAIIAVVLDRLTKEKMVRTKIIVVVALLLMVVPVYFL
jgi:hypothetical protein